MPLYEYKCNNPTCKACGQLVTRLVPVSERHSVHCEDCSSLLSIQVSVPHDNRFQWSKWRVPDEIKRKKR